MSTRRSVSPRFATVFAIMALAASSGLRAQQREGGLEDRRAYFRWIDLYPFFDESAYQNRVVAWEQLHRAGLRASLIPGAGQNAFAPLGPFGLVQTNGFFYSAPQSEGGRVAAIGLDPVRRNVFYAGTANGGVWKTTDGGATWRALTDDQCGNTIGSIVVDPLNTDIVYAATGEPSETSAHACGILRSTDGGSSWTRLGASTFTGIRIYTMIMDTRSAGSTNSTLVVAAENGLYRSTNGGATWTQLFAGRWSDVIAIPGNAAVMYAARFGVGSSNGALFRSQDGGATWSDVSGTFPGSNASRIEIAVSPAQPNSVWMIAGSRSTSSVLGVFRYDDPEGMVTLASSGLIYTTNRVDFGTQATYDLAIAVDPIDPARIYVGGVRAFRSLDGGNTFSEMAANIHADWHVLIADRNDANRVFAGNDGGIFVSYDRAASFQTRNYGLMTEMFYPGLSAHPTIYGFVLGGLQDNGAVRSGSFNVFEGVSGGDGAFSAINYNDPSIFWSACQYAGRRTPATPNGCLYRHTAGGSVSRTEGIDANDRHPFIAPIVMSPSDPTRLYYATQRLWRTVNEGLLWIARSTDLTKGGTAAIASIAEAPSDPNTVYVGTTDGNLWVSNDGTQTWRSANSGLPNRSLTDIAIDPSNALRAWVTAGGTGSGHAFATTDGGVIWTDISPGLPDVSTLSALVVPGTAHVFVGNDLGVYESASGNGGWSRVPGLPTVRANDLVYQARFNLVITGTYGRGIWAMDIGAQSTVLRGDVDRNGVVNAADALLIQQLLIGQQLPTPLTAFPHADANCDGSVSALDAVVILRFAVQANVGGACVGQNR